MTIPTYCLCLLHFIIFFLVWERHPVMLRSYSWLYTKEITPGNAQRTIYGVGDQTQVTHEQGKFLNPVLSLTPFIFIINLLIQIFILSQLLPRLFGAERVLLWVLEKKIWESESHLPPHPKMFVWLVPWGLLQTFNWLLCLFLPSKNENKGLQRYYSR